MSSIKELGELREKRAKLEDESRLLKEQQKKLEERAKALEEKIAEELKNSNKATRQAITQLEAMTNELEQKLKQISPQLETSRIVEETRSKSFLKKCISCEKTIPIASEECQYCGTAQPQNPEPIDDDAPGNMETNPEAESQENAVIVTAVEDSVTVQQEAGEDKRGNEKKKSRFL